jgi:hypothetical protein
MPLPYTRDNVRVFFGFDVEFGTNHIYFYGTPVLPTDLQEVTNETDGPTEETDGSFAQQQ